MKSSTTRDFTQNPPAVIAVNCQDPALEPNPPTPPPAGDAEFWFDGPAVYPEYLSDVNVMVCPSDSDGRSLLEAGNWNEQGDPALPTDPCAFGAISYMYLAWGIDDTDYLVNGVEGNSGLVTGQPSDIGTVLDAQFVVAISTMLGQASAGIPEAVEAYSGDIEFTSQDAEEITILRLREGIERFYITDINNPAASAKAQTEIPVLLDLVSTRVEEFNHIPGGGNVLFMDGHVGFQKYPSEFPIQRAWASLVSLF